MSTTNAAASSNATVKTQLKDYIQSRSLDDFFVELVENLLVESPSNPVKYIIDYLASTYPEQAKESSFMKTFAGDSSKGNIGGGVVMTGLMAVKGQGLNMDGNRAVDQDEEKDSDSETDSDSDSDGSDTEFLPLPPTLGRGKSRRNSICGESTRQLISQENTKKLQSQQDNTEGRARGESLQERSQGEQDAIHDTLQKSMLFQHLQLEEGDLQKVMKVMFYVEYQPGDVLLKEGDTGDNFYVIQEGEVVVTQRVDESDEEGKYYSFDPYKQRQVNYCTVGDSFGELALMYSAPRNATVHIPETTDTTLKLWALDRHSYKSILYEVTLQRRQEYVNYLDKVPILETLTEVERLTLADSLVKRTYNKGDVIIQQNESGDAFYILHEGQVRCTQQRNPSEAPQEIGVLEKGTYFGEIALLTNRPRAATVRVMSDTCECLMLDRRTFDRLAGSLIDILKRNLVKYNQFVGEQI